MSEPLICFRNAAKKTNQTKALSQHVLLRSTSLSGQDSFKATPVASPAPGGGSREAGEDGTG